MQCSYIFNSTKVEGNKIQYVCKFLAALEEQTISKRDINPHKEADLPYERFVDVFICYLHVRCVQLIKKYSPKATSKLLQMAFVEYMFTQLRKYEDSDFLKVAVIEGYQQVCECINNNIHSFDIMY